MRLLDAFGGATATAAPLAISIDAGPDAGLYSDDGCTVALAPTLPAYGGALSVRFRTPHAGALALKAGAPGLEEALAAAIQVVPGPPAGLAFTTAAQTVQKDACSAAVGVAVRDAFGNPARLPDGVSLRVAAPASLALYDAACAAALDGALPVSGDGTAQFRFKGSQPGVARVSVWLGSAASDSQDEAIE